MTAGAESNPAVELREVELAYHRAAPVVMNVSGTFEPGTITAILGPNAVGKSTLLKAIIGALPPRNGEILVRGKPPHDRRGRDLASRIVYVAQRPTVAADFTVREVVRLGRYALPANEARIEAALAELELEHLADRPVTELSVGQQQRAALGRAIAQLGDESVLVLDEPTASMDLRHAAAAYRVLKHAAQRGATVILAMHDLTAVTAAADRAWLMGPPEGREELEEIAAATLRAAGSVDEILRPRVLEPVFGLPFEELQLGSGRRVLLPAGR